MNAPAAGAAVAIQEYRNFIDGRWQAASDGRTVDVIVCDLNMPRMDGLSFMRWLRSHAVYRKVPLAVLTTETRPHMKLAVNTGGANAYIRKPCQASEFIDTVNRLCH